MLLSHSGAAFALLGITLATPRAPPLRQHGPKVAFSVPQTIPKAFVKSGPAALASTYSKYNKKIPISVKSAAHNNDGTVSANPEEYDSEYLSPVTIGGQTVNLDFDTGSADLWTFSSELEASSQVGHSIYDPSKSKDSQLLDGEYWSISYGDGSSASGIVYEDTVEVGETTAKKQAVGVSQRISYLFEQDVDNDGLLGLAFNKVNTVRPTKQRTFFDNVKDTLDKPLFAVDLKKNKPGTYDFGFIDRTKYFDSITWVPINPANGFWQFNSNGFAIGDGNMTRYPIDSIMDSGTTLILLPANIVSMYYARVSGSRYDSYQAAYTFPCNASLPSLTLGFGRYNAVIPGSYLNYAPLSYGDTMCFGGLQENTGIGIAIFGDVFMKSQYVVFDSRGPRLGVAPKML